MSTGSSDPAAGRVTGRHPALRLRDLSVRYHGRRGAFDAVREVSLQIEPGHVCGLVGESGSGKSTLALAVMGYLPPQAELLAGSVELNGQSLTRLSRGQMRRVWGGELSMVPQDPSTALNPTLRVGRQLAEALAGLAPGAARRRAIELLQTVGIAEAEVFYSRYPHQISGGMQQRVLIAMALGREPSLLLLDEPTTGLDSTTEAVILDLIRELMSERQTAALYISHSMGAVAQFADRVAVLYAGELVEEAPKVELFDQPLHPYTQGLLDSVPRLGESKRRIRLRAIDGRIPALGSLPPACVFEPRCPVAQQICREQRPPLEALDGGRQVRCHRWREIQERLIDPRQLAPAAATAIEPAEKDELQIERIEVRFRSRSGGLLGRRSTVRALNRVSLGLRHGQTTGLVGESGSGKTTLAKTVMGLVEPQSGAVRMLGAELAPHYSGRSRQVLGKLQMIFQHPDQALNPYLTVGESLSRPLVRLGGRSRPEASAEAGRLLEAVRLPVEFASRYPVQLSGGEKQRVAIARAFAALPEFVLCDEPVSSLDVSVQASILNLLNQLQAERGTSMLFISHDLAVVGYLADQVGVLYSGHLMELSPAAALFQAPYHPYTEALLSAVPLLDPRASQQRIRLSGELPTAAELPAGCPFHSRCPRSLGAICEQSPPPWQQTASGKRLWCHIPLDELGRLQGSAFHMPDREA